MAGFQLFNGKGNCNSCHVDGRGTTLTAAFSPDNSKIASTTPKFTCFGSANEGLPLNPRDAIYYQNTPDSFGFTANPDGFAFRDLGMGSFLRGVAAPNPNSDWTPFAPTVDGQFQVSTARNVAMTPPQCPTTEAGSTPYFQKGFFHNGYIKSLKQLVHFYNTRDVYPYNVTSGHCPAGTIEKGDLLAYARGQEQYRHDDRQARLDGSGGGPDRCVPANTHGRIHKTLPRQRQVYGRLHDL